MNNRFRIIVTQYNAVDYIKKCLDSIMSQTYKNYEIIVFDDCSDDGTLDIAQKYPVYIIRNSVHNLVPYLNFQKGIKLFPENDQDIIVFLSGDDSFFSDDVLYYLNEVYQDDVWMTYGNFIPASGTYGPYCQPIFDTRTYRRSGIWVTSHLVTFKKWLWDRIKEDDFKYNGEYPRFGFDRAFMYPMIEMSGNMHIRFIRKVLYIYNDQNPACLFKLDPQESERWAAYFMSKEIYDEL
jgi:glycosyltransferase involved in cell wall biosynthesis